MDILYAPPLSQPAQNASAERAPRVGVLASGSGTNFEAIARAVAAGELGVELACVIYNNPGAGVAERAEHHGVPAVLVDHRGFDGRAPFDAAVVATLREHGVEWVVMAGWMRVCTPALLDAFADRVLNIHPSLLPSFRGLDAIGQALDAGVTITGCTVHLVCLDVDAGPIVAQAAVPVAPDDDHGSLHARVQEAEHALYPRAIGWALARG